MSEHRYCANLRAVGFHLLLHPFCRLLFNAFGAVNEIDTNEQHTIERERPIFRAPALALGEGRITRALLHFLKVFQKKIHSRRSAFAIKRFVVAGNDISRHRETFHYTRHLRIDRLIARRTAAQNVADVYQKRCGAVFVMVFDLLFKRFDFTRAVRNVARNRKNDLPALRVTQRTHTGQG